jgi:hypothetical protein
MLGGFLFDLFLRLSLQTLSVIGGINIDELVVRIDANFRWFFVHDNRYGI